MSCDGDMINGLAVTIMDFVAPPGGSESGIEAKFVRLDLTT